MTRIIITDTEGHVTALKAERIEVPLAHGRQLILDFPPLAWGDLSIEAQTEEGHPILGLHPGASNLLTLRVDVHHDLLPFPDAQTSWSLSDEHAPLGWPAMLSLDVQKALKGHDKALPLPKKRMMRKWLRTVLTAQGHAHQVCITVRFVGKKEGRALNHEFRGKDAPTNILSFPYSSPYPNEKDPVLRGDLVLCVPVIIDEAHRQGKAPMAHYAHLLVHGMLHLLGFDHEDDENAQKMEAIERGLLSLLDFPDPYAPIDKVLT
jgi:probable rRNA maturation factor